jgi:hypothetical protein
MCALTEMGESMTSCQNLSGRTKDWPEPVNEEPDTEQLTRWALDSVVEATDGCSVEPDGVCPHGHPSWFLRLGLI